MLVMDIVNRAVMKSGVVSSFNPDEVPEDIQQRAADVLRNEIIRELNCDRNVDITETVLPFRVTRGRVDLVTTPLDYLNYIFPTVDFTASQLNAVEYRSFAQGAPAIPFMRQLIDLLRDMGLITVFGSVDYGNLIFTEKWPCTQLGQQIPIAFWTEDCQLFEVGTDLSKLYDNENPDFVNHKYNCPFYPAYIDEVYRAGDGAPLQYLHHGEMVSAEFRHSQLVYTVEDNITKMRIRFNPTCNPGTVLVVLPVPIKVINSFEEPHPWMGTIVAPEKFYSFLLNILAWRMAVEYGVDTKADMQRQAETSYANILRNKVRREHAQDIPREIFKYLRGRDTLTPVETNGYSGGYYG